MVLRPLRGDKGHPIAAVDDRVTADADELHGKIEHDVLHDVAECGDDAADGLPGGNLGARLRGGAKEAAGRAHHVVAPGDLADAGGCGEGAFEHAHRARDAI